MYQDYNARAELLYFVLRGSRCRGLLSTPLCPSVHFIAVVLFVGYFPP